MISFVLGVLAVIGGVAVLLIVLALVLQYWIDNGWNPFR